MEIKALNWSMIRNELLLTNPDLVQIIDNMDPDKQYTIYEAEYRWGEHLLHNGILYLPNGNEYIPLNSVNPTIAADLSYNGNLPVGIILNKSIESYLNALDTTIPLELLPKGSIFGLDNLANPVHTNIIAGSKSSLLLPRMRNDNAFNKLQRKLNLKAQPPRTISGEWLVFKELASHESISNPWTAKVIYFSKKWFEPQNDSNWLQFKTYLDNYYINSSKSGILMNKLFFDLAFSCTINTKSLKPDPYIADTIKHLFAISQNIYPGYTVAIDDSALPLETFQQTLLDIYDLKYFPTFMIPAYINNAQSVYYSLTVPTLTTFALKSITNFSKVGNLHQIQLILYYINEYIRKNLNTSPQLKLSKLISETQLEFYHPQWNKHSGIINTENLIHIDNNMNADNQKINDKKFCDTGLFLVGCIKIYKPAATN